VIASDDPVAGSGASTTVVSPAEEASISEGATYAPDLGDLASLVPRRRADVDRVAKPVPDDATHGEHAAAFLSGNFQPLEEEITASAIVRTRRTTPRAPSETEAAETDQQRDPAVAADILLGPEASRGSSKASSSRASDDDADADSDDSERCAFTSSEGATCEMRVLGSLPPGFPAGKFAYVGPNPKFAAEHYAKWGDGPGHENVGAGDGWHHWFEGDGMVYAVDFSPEMDPSPEIDPSPEDAASAGEEEGEGSSSSFSRVVTYRNRYVRTNSWHDELAEGRRLFAPLMNAGGASFLPHAVQNLFRGGYFLKDSANTALASFAGRLLALQDTMPPWELDGATLETKGACDFDGKLPFYVPFTAHPKTAPGTGELIFFGFNPVYPPHVSVGSVRPDGEMGEIKSLWHNALQGATFVHDFCVTTRHVVLFEGSMNIRPLRMAGLRHPLAYDETQKARFGVLRRRANGTIPGVEVDEDVIWCECESHEMVYHFVNAWEDEGSGEIVVTGVREDGFFHGALRAKGTRAWIADALTAGERTPRVHEWRLDPATGAVTSERFVFPNDVVEVPRINDRWTGVKNRFAYAGRVHEPSLARDAQLKFDAVVKFDFETETTEVYEHGPGRYGTETQFVPRRRRADDPSSDPRIRAEDEDDGWLVMFVHDERAGATEGRSECVVIDAARVAAGPVTRIVLPSRVPYGAHALWTPLEEDQDRAAGGGGGRGSSSSSSASNSDASGILAATRDAVAAAEAAALLGAFDSVDDDTLWADRGSATGGSSSLCLNPNARRAATAIAENPPTPRPFVFASSQVGALAGAAATGVGRLASGLFVEGWRPRLGADRDATEYAFVRGLGVKFTEASRLGTSRARLSAIELDRSSDFSAEEDRSECRVFHDAFYPPLDARSNPGVSSSDLASLVLYEREGCGGSRRVREALTMLDLACACKPCPLGATRHRAEAAAMQRGARRGGSGARDVPKVSVADVELPFLVETTVVDDARDGARSSTVTRTFTGADEIVTHLYSKYLDGEAPSPLVRPGAWAGPAAQAACDARGSADASPNPRGTLRRGVAGSVYARPSVAPERPLQLWAYEASPFCALVRETLSELEIPYVLQPCGRGSARRTVLRRRAGRGRFQVPYLEDPNTGAEMFESERIIEYLRKSYQVSPPTE
jgi:carotenoid cleavage dioxygenase-like enzyme